MSDINPRYLAYCRAHGMTPDEMLAHDRQEYPGGVNVGFVNWFNAQWRAWRASIGLTVRRPLTDAEVAAFDAWLGVPK
ncbi:MAG: hypothetical protein V1912_11300 [bacterium]